MKPAEEWEESSYTWVIVSHFWSSQWALNMSCLFLSAFPIVLSHKGDPFDISIEYMKCFKGKSWSSFIVIFYLSNSIPWGKNNKTNRVIKIVLTLLIRSQLFLFMWNVEKHVFPNDIRCGLFLSIHVMGIPVVLEVKQTSGLYHILLFLWSGVCWLISELKFSHLVNDGNHPAVDDSATRFE